MLVAKGVPEAQVDALLSMMEKDPELFKKIALEIDEKMKKGEERTKAAMEVMKKYEAELRRLVQ